MKQSRPSVRARALALGAAALATTAFGRCRRESAPPAAGAPEAAAPPTAASWEEVRAVLVREDERRVDAVLVAATRSPDPALRRRAAWALGRIGLPSAETPLLGLLSDPDLSVRRAAAYAAAFLEGIASRDAETAIVGRWVAEDDETVRAHLLTAAGRVGTASVEPLLLEALAHGPPALARAAAEAFGSLGLRTIAVGPEAYQTLARALASAPDVALAAAFALTRLPPPTDASREEVGRALAQSARSPSPDTRALSLRALGRFGDGDEHLDVLSAAAADPDWRVRVNAVRALGERGPSGARALAGSMQALFAGAHAGRDLHPLLQALESAADRAEEGAIAEAAQALFTAADPTRVPRDADAPRVQCAAAFVLDRGKNWPSRVLRCGGDAVSPTRRQLLAVAVLEKGHGGDAARARELRRMVRSPGGAGSASRIVRSAALRALGSIGHPEAWAAIVEGLASTDPIDIGAAADAIVEARGRPEAAETPVPDGPAIAERFVRGIERVSAAGQVEALLSVLAATRALGAVLPVSARLRDALGTHARSGNPSVRRLAREALVAMGAPVPAEADVATAPNPLDVDAVRRILGTRPHARIATSRGEIRIALLADAAPGTVLNFIRLARRGFYDGLAFHRVVPNFVVQAGDPLGDGSGGPGYTIRCEYDDEPYTEGAVGMALAGRDTGGSQFFIAHAPQPRLDGRYTLFGRVESGQDVVDAIQIDDRIEHIAIDGTP